MCTYDRNSGTAKGRLNKRLSGYNSFFKFFFCFLLFERVIGIHARIKTNSRVAEDRAPDDR